MFSIIKSVRNEFNKGLDEEKLINFKKKARTVNESKLQEYCEEIHYIMQRHFTNQKILYICKDTLKYIEKLKQLDYDGYQ